MRQVYPEIHGASAWARHLGNVPGTEFGRSALSDAHPPLLRKKVVNL